MLSTNLKNQNNEHYEKDFVKPETDICEQPENLISYGFISLDSKHLKTKNLEVNNHFCC